MTEPETTEIPTRPQPSLRERKFARTKLALMQATFERLRTKPLHDITVKELCEEVEVSEATFFNYFPQKHNLLHYFIRYWTLEVMLHARAAAGDSSGLSYIEAILGYTGKQLATHPRIMLEIIGHMALHVEAEPCDYDSAGNELSVAERMLAFPDVPDVADVPSLELEDLFRLPLTRAVENGELPATVDIDAALLTLVSIFFGVTLWLGKRDPTMISQAFDRQLELLWAGLRGHG